MADHLRWILIFIFQNNPWQLSQRNFLNLAMYFWGFLMYLYEIYTFISNKSPITLQLKCGNACYNGVKVWSKKAICQEFVYLYFFV